jgi:hypothetical protein
MIWVTGEPRDPSVWKVKFPKLNFRFCRFLRSWPSEVATRHTKIRRLAYILGSYPALQSDQSSSRAALRISPLQRVAWLFCCVHPGSVR